MPPDPHHKHEVPMFDIVMGEVMPTFSTLADDDRRSTCDHGRPDSYGMCTVTGCPGGSVTAQ